MRVLVAMSGGVDSSVAAALLKRSGAEVVGATMKLWGGPSDSGCCSAADVQDARRAADRIGIEHHVFNFTETFDAEVVDPYIADHAAGRTPNPCVECNRKVKFGAMLDRARRLGFDALATGHYARVDRGPDGRARLRRGLDQAKDQSYVLSVLGEEELSSTLLPIGDFAKREVRELAEAFGLPNAAKPDSQDVCFIPSRGTDPGRAGFVGARTPLHPGTVVDLATGAELGSVAAVELVTVGQRRGLGVTGNGRRFAVDVDVERRRVVVGDEQDLLVAELRLGRRTWVGGALATGAPCAVQCSAHGRVLEARVSPGGVLFETPSRRVAPGQLVALYEGDVVVGSGVAK